MLRAERDALLDKLDDLEGQVREGDEERADLEGELDRVKRDQNKLRRDASFVHKVDKCLGLFIEISIDIKAW